jgi:uncharacterized protein (UPF0332 family)
VSEREVRELASKAERSLVAARRLPDAGDYDFAVSRAYYAMFYVARALLLTRNVRRSKHSGVLAAFASEFVRSGELPAELFALLRDGFEDRSESDYGLVVISEDQARVGVEGAHRFVRTLVERLAPILGPGNEGITRTFLTPWDASGRP